MVSGIVQENNSPLQQISWYWIKIEVGVAKPGAALNSDSELPGAPFLIPEENKRKDARLGSFFCARVVF
jgi:hypothetical protein